MSPSSQRVLIEPAGGHPVGGALLAEAFSDFIVASSRLEHSYRDLQAEVAELSQALSERNRALSESLSDNRALGERLQRILESIPCGVVVVDNEGSVQLANPEAVRLLTLSTGEVQAFHTHLKLAPALRMTLDTSLPLHEGHEQEICMDGPTDQVWLAIRCMQLPLAKCRVPEKAELLLTLRDISARKRMEDEREAARDAVALAQVSALLAHEIRNPLASLELITGLLEEDAERRSEWLFHLRAGIRSLSGTVNNVLALHGHTPLSLELMNLSLEGALAVDFLQPLAKQCEVALFFVPAEGDPEAMAMQARGNRSAFHQVLLNLCTNALRHTSRAGSVLVTCHAPSSTDNDTWCVSVQDTGCGIKPEDLPHLFEVGFSGSGTTCGLGLAVSQRLVRQMGGVLSVTSRLGYGSTFVLELPRA